METMADKIIIDKKGLWNKFFKSFKQTKKLAKKTLTWDNDDVLGVLDHANCFVDVHFGMSASDFHRLPGACWASAVPAQDHVRQRPIHRLQHTGTERVIGSIDIPKTHWINFDCLVFNKAIKE